MTLADITLPIHATASELAVVFLAKHCGHCTSGAFSWIYLGPILLKEVPNYITDLGQKDRFRTQFFSQRIRP